MEPALSPECLPYFKPNHQAQRMDDASTSGQQILPGLHSETNDFRIFITSQGTEFEDYRL
ncbi:MAG: hypothetical protein CL481_07065 [Acidobacteria bacterium]|nr:hypothetical protein [Acidobacteriota bacterium]